MICYHMSESYSTILPFYLFFVRDFLEKIYFCQKVQGAACLFLCIFNYESNCFHGRDVHRGVKTRAGQDNGGMIQVIVYRMEITL